MFQMRILELVYHQEFLEFFFSCCCNSVVAGKPNIDLTNS
jgi:hypothetical protein